MADIDNVAENIHIDFNRGLFYEQKRYRLYASTRFKKSKNVWNYANEGDIVA